MARTLVNQIKKNQPRNLIINGAMDFYQRGSSFNNLGNTYTADRWYRFRQGGGTTGNRSEIITNSTAVVSGGTALNFLRFGRTDGTVDINQQEVITALETKDSIKIAGKTIVVSFLARAGVGFSGTGLASYVGTGEGIDEGVVAPWINAAILSPSEGDFLLTTSFQRFYYTVDVPSNVSQIRLDFNYTPSGTATDDYVDITEIMIHEGLVPVPFERAGESYSEELQLCQRYFSKSFDVDFPPSNGGGSFITTTGLSYHSLTNIDSGSTIYLPNIMRAQPIVTRYGNSNGSWKANNSFSSSVTITANGNKTIEVNQQAVDGIANCSGHFTADSEL